MRITFTLFLLLYLCTAQAQVTSTFEDLQIPLDTFYDGSDFSGGFHSGDAFYPNFFDPNYFFWLGGWAYSTMRDSITSGPANQYSAKAAGGYLSDTYAVGQNFAVLRYASETSLGLVYVTNSTYAYTSMRDGDLFAEPFGGDSGDEPDFFYLKIQAFRNGNLQPDSVVFYLADYRFEDNSQDFLVRDWHPVDLSPLGPVDSLLFTLRSSDVGPYGINTPAYFCIDNFNETVTGLAQAQQQLSVRFGPNPVSDLLQIWELPEQGFLKIATANGEWKIQQALNGKTSVTLDLRTWPSGLYWIQVRSQEGQTIRAFVKE